MNFVKAFDLFGVEAKQIPTITGEGAPTTETECVVGCLYMDTTNGDLYKCTSVTDGVYAWVLQGSGGAVDVDGELNENSTNPVQNKVITKAINLMGELNIAEEFVPSKNLFSGDMEDGYCYVNGTTGEVVVATSSWETSRLIKVEPNAVYVPSVDGAITNECYWCVYAADGVTRLAGKNRNGDPFTIPEGGMYVRVTVLVGAKNVQLEKAADPNNPVPTAYEPYVAPPEDAEDYFVLHTKCLPEEIAQLPERVNALEADVADLKESGGAIDEETLSLMGNMYAPKPFIPSKNLYNPVYAGYDLNWYNPANEGLTENAAWNTCEYISVTEGQAFSVSAGGDEATPGTLYGSHHVCLYDAGKGFVKGSQKTNPITIPAGVSYMRVAVRNTAINVQIEEGTEPTAYEEYREPPADDEPAFYLNRDPIGYFRASGDLADGDELTVPENNVRTNTVIVFSCHIGTLDKLIIGERDGSTPYLIIDNTNVEIYGAPNKTYTKPHGLTIRDNLLVRIESEADDLLVHNDSNAFLFAKRITVTSGEQTFELNGNDEYNRVQWLGDRKGAYVRSDGSTLTNCVLSWTCRNIAKPVWVFGDSYVSHEYTVRWPYYLYADGYGDALMLNGYAGENSAAAMVSLKNLLTIGRPQYIVWALGMNDPDEAVTVDTSWQECFDAVAALCGRMNIKFIACTIPQTPTMNNAHKNAVIRASGYRYIDFEKAVVADVTTGDWYAGMRADETDPTECHPSTAGAKALYYRLLCDFPEIMTL